jgi:ARG and Rhodanese-Phosphatase-superfamily-associated Protein domain
MADQGAVWDRIADKSARLRADSATSAMSAVFEKLDVPLESFVRAFASVEHQNGAIFLIDDTVVGMDVFDSPTTWARLSPKLIRSYLVDAIDRQKHPRMPARRTGARAFVDTISAGTPKVFPATGEGDDIRLSGDSVVGAALVARGRTIHVSAFIIEEGHDAHSRDAA